MRWIATTVIVWTVVAPIPELTGFVWTMLSVVIGALHFLAPAESRNSEKMHSTASAGYTTVSLSRRPEPQRIQKTLLLS